MLTVLSLFSYHLQCCLQWYKNIEWQGKWSKLRPLWCSIQARNDYTHRQIEIILTLFFNRCVLWAIWCLHKPLRSSYGCKNIQLQLCLILFIHSLSLECTLESSSATNLCWHVPLSHVYRDTVRFFEKHIPPHCSHHTLACLIITAKASRNTFFYDLTTAIMYSPLALCACKVLTWGHWSTGKYLYFLQHRGCNLQQGS